MISVVIPAFNEKDAIADTVRRVKETLAAAKFEGGEVIVVDDASTDGTERLAEEAGARVVRHPQNAGYGRSLKDGILAARHDTIVITDADGTYPLERIPDLVARYKQGFNLVVGARRGKNLDPYFLKKVLRGILKWLVEFTTGRDIPDINSGLRVFSKKECVPFFPNLSNAFSFTTSQCLAYMMTGKFVAFEPIDYFVRVGQGKVRLLRDSLRTLQYITEAILFYNPIKLFLVFSGFLLLLAVAGYGVYALRPGSMALFFAFQMTALSFLVFALGLVSVLLKHILHAAVDRTPSA